MAMAREHPHRRPVAAHDQAPAGRGRSSRQAEHRRRGRESSGTRSGRSPPSAASYARNSGALTAVLTIFRDSADVARSSSLPELPRDVIWIDLLNPTKEETTFVESRTKVRIPSIEMLSEIETSSRLAVDHGVVYLSIPAVAQGDSVDAYLSPTGFILTNRVLVTIRFSPLSTFNAVTKQVTQDETLQRLLEAMVDRGADVLELLGAELNNVSKSVFRGDPSRPKHIVRSNNVLRRALTAVGTTGDRLALARDALLGIGRIAPFVLSLREDWITPEFEARLEAVTKDIVSLNDYEAHLSSKVQFLLDAILGFITIQQNDLFKVLTIVSVVGIPPTLVAGIYGMNFKYMPELNWVGGYPFGLAVIVLSGLIPLAWFKWRGWF
jgi:magnesium transporter